jgi:Cu(I)/Ag(I) efflux system periplasmic protein CusF
MTKAIRFRPALWLSLALLAPPVLAQTTNGHQGHHAAPAAEAPASAAPATPAADGAWAQAEVRRVDAKAGKVTLKHGDIPNLAMPPMTMVFQVQDPQTLTNIKVGDRVRFTADQINGAYTVLNIEAAP